MKKPKLSTTEIERATQATLTSDYIKRAGHKAIVKREEVLTDARGEALKDVIRDVGRDLLETGQVPQGMTYLGSLAVHIYKSDLLNEAAFYKQILSEDGDQCIPLMKAAALELTGEIDFALTGKRPTKRSGFSG